MPTPKAWAHLFAFRAYQHNILSSDLLKHHKLVISADPLKNVHQSFINVYYILPYVY